VKGGVGGRGELQIGHSIGARAVLVGLERAVREMKAIIRRAPAMVGAEGWLPPIGF